MTRNFQETTEKGDRSVFSRALLVELESLLKKQCSQEQLRDASIEKIGLQLAEFVALKELNSK